MTKWRVAGVATLLLCTWAAGAVAQGSGLSTPFRLALGPQGEIAVSEFSRNRVAILDWVNLEVVETIDLGGEALGVAFFGDRLLVGIGGKNKVEIYRRDKKGPFKRQGNLGEGAPLPAPTDIAVDEAENLVFVLSGDEDKVYVLPMTDENGENGGPGYAFGGRGGGAAQLYGATGLAVDTQNKRVLVSQYGDSKDGSLWIPPEVKIFDYVGNRVDAILYQTFRRSQFAFRRPWGLAVDELGRVYLTEGLRGEVMLFSRESGPWAGVAKLGSGGSAPGQLWLPQDVVVEPYTSRVLVTSSRTGRVEVYEQGGVLP
jgi:DNA-binding beta-propeller fold protein YncE